MGRVVKGVGFVDLRDAGDPVELACRYDGAGADELVFLDITATSDKRETVVELARRTADDVFIPFTIGGGIRSVADAQAVLDAGADKISINSAALAAARADRRAARARSARSAWCWRSTRRRRPDGGWEAYLAGGRTPTGRDAVAWAKEGVERGAGEILLTSMDRDGTNAGYDLKLTAAVAERVGVPVIASGGAGELDDLTDAINAGADAVLCASIFHYGHHTVAEVKEHLAAAGIPVRRACDAVTRSQVSWRDDHRRVGRRRAATGRLGRHEHGAHAAQAAREARCSRRRSEVTLNSVLVGDGALWPRCNQTS